jgi:hypothetical protein
MGFNLCPLFITRLGEYCKRASISQQSMHYFIVFFNIFLIFFNIFRIKFFSVNVMSNQN